MADTSNSIVAPAAHPFQPEAWLSDFAALGGGFHVSETRLDFDLLIGNQTGAVMISGQVTITSLTPNMGGGQ